MSDLCAGTRQVRLTLPVAPVEDLSDDESTGGSIPYNNAEHDKDIAGDVKEEEEDDDENEEEGM